MDNITARLTWWFCAACYHIYILLPKPAGVSAVDRALLPWAGIYAHNANFDEWQSRERCSKAKRWDARINKSRA